MHGQFVKYSRAVRSAKFPAPAGGGYCVPHGNTPSILAFLSLGVPLVSRSPMPAARLHSASVGRRQDAPAGILPALRSVSVSHAQNAFASFQLTFTTG